MEDKERTAKQIAILRTCVGSTQKQFRDTHRNLFYRLIIRWSHIRILIGQPLLVFSV